MFNNSSADAICAFISFFQNIRESKEFSDMLWKIYDYLRKEPYASEDSVRQCMISEGYTDDLFDAFVELVESVNLYQ